MRKVQGSLNVIQQENVILGRGRGLFNSAQATAVIPLMHHCVHTHREREHADWPGDQYIFIKYDEVFTLSPSFTHIVDLCT